MRIIYLLSGILLFAIIAVDIIKTTLSAKGGGFVSDKLVKGVWLVFFSACGRNGKSRALEFAGSAVLMAILLVWILGLWLSLFLLLLSDGGSIINSTSRESATIVEKFYYAGFTLSTLGVGDFVAASNSWRIVTGVAAFAGLVFITASITYFVPVLSAVNLQSKLSLYVSSMGKSPQEVLVNSWNGRDFSAFFSSVPEICQMLLQHSLNHHSYPVVHFFHNKEPNKSIIVKIVVLEEVYRILRQEVASEIVLEELKMVMLRSTLDNYLQLIKENFIYDLSSHDNPPHPELTLLHRKEIPVKKQVSADQNQSREQSEKRDLLTALLASDGWSWQEVYPDKNKL